VSYVDLRGFIDQVDRLGALRRVDGADAYLEIGGITEVAAALPDCPALVFDRIKGLPSGFRIFYECDDQFTARLFSAGN
jgi:3-polyprenyl-4-hydroxybenzoate decarboxylase